MTISAFEFIRRFLVHVLPQGFVRIRHFGIMANYQRSLSLDFCRQRLNMAPVTRSTEIAPAVSAWACRKCGGSRVDMTKDVDPVLTAKEVAQDLRCSKSQVYRLIAGDVQGLGWVDYQVLRRKYATLMRKAGVNPKVVADSMGHDLDVNLNT